MLCSFTKLVGQLWAATDLCRCCGLRGRRQVCRKALLYCQLRCLSLLNLKHNVHVWVEMSYQHHAAFMAQYVIRDHQSLPVHVLLTQGSQKLHIQPCTLVRQHWVRPLRQALKLTLAAKATVELLGAKLCLKGSTRAAD